MNALYAPPARQQLREEARDGSPEALGALLQAYRPLLVMLANQALSPAVRVKGGDSDLVQDTFLEAVGAFPDFTGTTAAEFQAWLRQILRHNVTDLVHRFCGTDKRQLAVEVRLDGAHCSPDLLADRTSDPLETALEHERLEALERAFGKLSPGDREVIQLRHEQHLPFDDIARRLGCTELAVRRRWERALERWRDEFQSEYGTP